MVADQTSLQSILLLLCVTIINKNIAVTKNFAVFMMLNILSNQ